MAKALISKTELIQERHQIVWRLHHLGMNQEQIGKAVGYDQSNISLILQSIRSQGGIEKYKVGTSPGNGGKLSEEQEAQLKACLNREAKSNGFATEGWTQKRVQALIEAKFGVSYSRAHMSDLLSRLGFSLQVPSLKDVRRDEPALEVYEKQVLPKLKKKQNRQDTK
jgi:transposase